MPATPSHRRARRGMTLVEILLVLAIIAGLMAILLPALRMVRGNAVLVKSQTNMRQIASYLTMYGNSNKGYVVPSQFDYSTLAIPPKVRSASPAGQNPNIGPMFVGSWSDILWTMLNQGPLPVEYDAGDSPPSPTWDYRFDSPDYWAYKGMEEISADVFRSAVPLNKPFDEANDAALPTPFGTGAGQREKGQPGYFAANDFFDCRAGDWYTIDMILRPSSSVYLVDSRAGETIPTTDAAWLPDSTDGQVEFRYIGDTTLMLYLDGHVAPESKWVDLVDLQANRPVRVRNLNQN